MNAPWNIQQAAAALRGGTISAVELLEQCLKQVDRHEAEIQAWVLVDRESARQQARTADEELTAGQDRGWLHGIPLAIKDIVDVAGWPTRCGSTIPSAEPAARDATLVARLKNAGAVLMGKTVTTEFASFDPPVTRNPWNLERTPGGSSSGSAAAVAAGMCLGAIGSQTGGSITRPASFCGVAGLKPSYGRVSLAGVYPLAFGLDHPGPIGRNAFDLGAILRVIAGPDLADPLCLSAPVDDYPAAVRSLSRAPKLGVPRGSIWEEADEDVRGISQRSIEQLSEAGAEIEWATLPDSFDQVVAMHRRLMAVGAAQTHKDWFPARRAEYGPKIASLIDEGWKTSSVDYAEAVMHQQRFKQEILESLRGCDVLVMPATVTAAPGKDSTGDPRFNSPWSYSGLPVASFPCGLNDDGMPICLQLIGHPLGESRLLAIAAWAERVLDFSAVPTL